MSENPPQISNFEKTPSEESIDKSIQNFEPRVSPVVESIASEGEKEVKLNNVRARLARNTRTPVHAPATPIAAATVETVFSPRNELKYILSADRAERKQKLAEYKQKLLKQQEAMAKGRVDIEKILDARPDTPKDEVLRTLDTPLYKNHFSDESKAVASEFLDRYYESRAKVLEIRKKFPDNRELVRHLTGKDLPVGSNVGIRIGPMTIEVYADRDDLQGFLYKKPGEAPTQGFAGTSADGIRYSFINRQAADSKTTQIHEQQHQTNNLFNETYGRVVDQHEVSDLKAAYDAESDTEKKKDILRELFSLRLNRAYDSLKDELFAMASDGSDYGAAESYFKPGSDHEYYDYLKATREERPKDPIWKEVSNEMLVKEYTRVMHNAVGVIKELGSHYSAREIIAMLTEVPLEDWTKRAARISQEKLKDPTITAGEVLKVMKEDRESKKVPEGAKGHEEKKVKKNWKKMSTKEKIESVADFAKNTALMSSSGVAVGVAATGIGMAASIGAFNLIGASSAIGPVITTAGLAVMGASILGAAAHAFFLEYFALNIITEGYSRLKKWLGSGILAGGSGGSKPAKAAAHKPAGGGGGHGGGH